MVEKTRVPGKLCVCMYVHMYVCVRIYLSIFVCMYVHMNERETWTDRYMFQFEGELKAHIHISLYESNTLQE